MARKPAIPKATNDDYENNPSGDLMRGIDNNFLSRLSETIRQDRLATEKSRSTLVEFTQQYVGSYYGAGGTNYEIPLPLIATFLQIHSRSLIPKEPRCGLVTFNQKMMPAVDAMENWQNDWFEEIELGDIFRYVVMEGLMMEGIVKIDLLPPEVAEAGYNMEAGQPYICPIHQEDWVCDMEARRFAQCDYYAYKYYVPKEVAADILDKKIHTNDPSVYDETGVPKMFTIGAGANSRQRIEDYVELWSVCLKRKNLKLTIRSVDGLPGTSKKDILRVREYLGPKWGNVIRLGYGTVPGNLRYYSPVMGIMPLHLAANRSYRKLIETADNYKEVLPVRGGSAGKDGKAIKDSMHMQIINADNPNDIQPKRFNLPPAELQLFVDDLRSAFDYIGGGISALGGRGVSAPTATQEKIVTGNAMAGVSDMAAITTSFVARVYKTLGWYLWYHPRNVYDTVKKVDGLDKKQIQRKLYPFNDELPGHQDLIDAEALMREGPMPRYRVDPFSIQHLSPAERNAFIDAVMATTAPYAAIMAQQGYFPDFGEWLKLKAKFGDEPAIAKIWKFQGAPQQAEGEGEQSGLNKEISVKPAETTRNYTRQSSGGSANQQANDRRSALMSAMSTNGQA